LIAKYVAVQQNENQKEELSQQHVEEEVWDSRFFKWIVFIYC